MSSNRSGIFPDVFYKLAINWYKSLNLNFVSQVVSACYLIPFWAENLAGLYDSQGLVLSWPCNDFFPSPVKLSIPSVISVTKENVFVPLFTRLPIWPMCECLFFVNLFVTFSNDYRLLFFFLPLPSDRRLALYGTDEVWRYIFFPRSRNIMCQKFWLAVSRFFSFKYA
jgi:hypothetical protein